MSSENFPMERWGGVKGWSSILHCPQTKVPGYFFHCGGEDISVVLLKIFNCRAPLVFARSAVLNANFNPDTHLIGVRIPDNSFIRSVCALTQSPLALTSANYSAGQSCLDVNEFQYLHKRYKKMPVFTYAANIKNEKLKIILESLIYVLSL